MEAIFDGDGRPIYIAMVCEQGISMYYALIYEVVDDYEERRKPYRQEHLAYADHAYRRGLLILGGAFNPADGALLIFRADNASLVEEFARGDPYVRQGLVKNWRVREWAVVIGLPA